MRMYYFWAQNGPFPWTKVFLVKTINITFMYLLAPFTVQNFEKNAWSGSTVMRMHHFWAQKGPFAPNKNFFIKPVNKPCSFHSCLSTFQKSKTYQSTDEILTIKKYWNLISQEAFLAISWEPDFSQACSLCRMLRDHKNFHFIPIPGKTIDLIFLKSPKTLFLGHFWPFLVIFAWRIFSKKSGSVTHNYIWALNTMLNFRKN